MTKKILLTSTALIALWMVSIHLFPVDAANNNGYLILPPTQLANRVPVTNSTTIGDITFQQVPNAALVNASVTVNGSTCTLGASCSPSGGISGPLYSQVTTGTSAASGANSLVDVTSALGSVTIASSILNTAGNVLHVYVAGLISNAGTPGTLTLRVRLASTNVCSGTYAGVTGLNGNPWSVDVYITSRTPGSSGTLMCNGSIAMPSGNAGALLQLPLNDGGGSFNTTGNQTFDFTAQWNAFASGDSISATNLVLAQI